MADNTALNARLSRALGWKRVKIGDEFLWNSPQGGYTALMPEWTKDIESARSLVQAVRRYGFAFGRRALPGGKFAVVFLHLATSALGPEVIFNNQRESPLHVAVAALGALEERAAVLKAEVRE